MILLHSSSIPQGGMMKLDVLFLVGSRWGATMIVKEVRAKTILSVSKVYDYVINPYTGCQHACTYCYARFMKRFSGHKEPWGAFVDIKINAPDLLRADIAKKKRGRVWISGVCDPYQPLERKFKLTRKCLEIIAQADWPVIVQTRSPLVLRDLDILRAGSNWQVGLSITTADDHIRRLFEPAAPPIADRIKALDELHRAGMKTYVTIAPILPGADALAELLEGKVNYVLMDRMNYNHANRVYRQHGLEHAMEDGFFKKTERELATKFSQAGIACEAV